MTIPIFFTINRISTLNVVRVPFYTSTLLYSCLSYFFIYMVASDATSSFVHFHVARSLEPAQPHARVRNFGVKFAHRLLRKIFNTKKICNTNIFRFTVVTKLCLLSLCRAGVVVQVVPPSKCPRDILP